MGKLLYGLGRFCARRALVMIGIWVLIVVVVSLAVARFGSETNNDLRLPGTGSQEVKDLLTERFPPQQNGVNPIVFNVTDGKLTDDKYKKDITDSVKAIRKTPHVYSVTNPISSSGQTAGLLSKDGKTAFAPVLLDIGSGELTEEIAQDVVDATDPAQKVGVDVEAAGSIGTELSTEPTEISEVVGIVAAMIILSIVLGSLVAMGMPIITAVIGLGVALALVGLVGHIVSMPSSGPTLATMIGLGVGIDYALFLITRHQDQLRAGVEMKESIARAVATSGSAIVFAGCTVVIALLSLGVAGIPLVSALGLASAIGVIAAVLAAISLLPAFLGLLGPRIHRLALPRFLSPPPKPGGGMWASWAGVVTRHPIWVTIGSLALLIPLIIPVFSLELGQEDIGAANPKTTERKAYDLITAGFGVGYNGPLQVASKLDPPAAPSSEFTKKYNKAQSLQKDLEKKQKQLPKQQKALEKQQKELEAEQASLEDQKALLQQQQAALEASGANLQNQQAQLEAQAARLQNQQARLEAKQAALEKDGERLRNESRALAEEAQPLIRELRRINRHERILERRIDQLTGHPRRLARLQERLQELQDREAQVRKQLAPLKRQGRHLIKQGRKLAERAENLSAKASQLQSEADELERQKSILKQQAAELQRQANALQRQGNELQRQGDALQEQGDELQQQADELKAEQQQAEQEKKQAQKLQKQLTAQLTQAGGDERGTDPRIVTLQNDLTATSGVVALTPLQINKHGDVAVVSAVPSTSPASDATADLVGTVRDDVLPKSEAAGGITSYVGGYTASYVDLAALITARLLLVIGTVILLGFLLLMVAFRSLLVPLQAAITNLLSAAAAFGVLTAAFQWGWGISFLGLDTPSSGVPIASYVPLMMFAGLFGLSMDYEVFLVSHIQMHHHGGEEPRRAVASGLGSSARITTAAALIMASVFASFVLNGDPTIKQFGVGLSVAVLLAGILVVTLGPAIISLFGAAAWWLPKWLDRLLPHISVEGEQESVDGEPESVEGEQEPPAGSPGAHAADPT